MINLLYCANATVFDGIFLSLMSATSKATCPITAYIMTMDLSKMCSDYLPIEEKHIEILNTVVKRENPDNQVVLIDATKVFIDKMANSPNLTSGYTPYTLLRLLACEFDLPKRIVYVDADTMFNGDISNIERYNIDEYELAGVVDYLGKRFIAKDYVNAGVLYLNMEKIRKTRLFDKALNLCLTKKMIFPDQDAINEMVEYKLLLPSKFNEQHKWKSDTIIQHFSKTIYFFPVFKVINIKQWQIELVQEVLKIHAYDSIYSKYLKYRKELGSDFLKPLQTYTPYSIGKQMKINYNELKSYIRQNGGIFRKE